MQWWDDLTGLFEEGYDATKDFIKEEVDGDFLKGVGAVAGAIGQYQANENAKDQFDAMMQLKMDDYNRSIQRQDMAQNALNQAVGDVFTPKEKVDCTQNPTHPDCQILG